MRSLLGMLVMIGCVGTAAAALAAPSPLPMERPLTIAAIVNDDVITSQDVEERALLLMALTGAGGSPQARARVVSQSLSMLMDETLQMQEAERHSIRVSDEEIADAMREMEAKRGKTPGALAAFLKANDLSEDSMRKQYEAQLAWRKTVLQKLRRNLSVTDAEITRAQQTARIPRTVPQVQIAALSVAIPSSKQEAAAAQTAQKLAERLRTGTPFETLAREIAGKPNMDSLAPVWANESDMEPAMVAALQSLEPGQITQPLRSRNTYQIVRLMARRDMPPVSPDTEVAIKHMKLALRPDAKQSERAALSDIARSVQDNPGTCGEKGIAGITDFAGTDIRVDYLRLRLKDMTPELVALVAPLSVGETTTPYSTPSGMELLMLCEKIEAPMPMPSREEVRSRLIAQRADLEAEKMLRNLKRDAFIDIRTGSPR